ncbi:MAG: DoxX family protein [Phycisphaeraceae bacterium]|nr:DoxX family protein [Phycisphaeraceae bacterium]
MRFRDSLAVNVSPIFLRLVLAATFLWAGYGKVFVKGDYTPQEIATLESMGAAPADEASQPNMEVIEPGATTPEAPIPDPAQQGADQPASGDPQAVAEPAYRVITVQDEGEFTDAQNPDAAVDDEAAAAPAEAAPQQQRLQLYRVALLIHETKLLPGFLSEGAWPVRLAWIAALTELLGGAFVLVGLLTRLSALGLAITMLTALWLTGIGSVLVYQAPSSYGFLPKYDAQNPMAWMVMLWQFALLGAALALLFSGPGALSVDRFLIGRRAARHTQPQRKPRSANRRPDLGPEDDDD